VKSLVYQDTPRYDLWLKLIIAAVLLATFIPGLLLLPDEPDEALAMFGVTLFVSLLLKAVLPRRFQIFEDGLRIVLGGPFGINLPFAKLKKIRLVSQREAVFHWGVSFITSYRGVVEIAPKKGMAIFIAPSDSERFLELANQALQNALKSG
jgi:hypothetical protein